MLSFTLEGDRWRVAGTFDTGTLQQEFDRPSCKRSSLLLYLFFLFLTIFFFLSFSFFCLDLFLFALCVTRPFARSQLSFDPFAFTRFLFYRSSLSFLALANCPTLLLLLLPLLLPSPSFCTKYTFRERSTSMICEVHFVSESESWKLQIYPASRPSISRFPHSISSSSLFFPSVVIFLFIYLRILPAFYFILFYNRIILRLVLLDRAAFPALDASTKERYMSVLILDVPSFVRYLKRGKD